MQECRLHRYCSYWPVHCRQISSSATRKAAKKKNEDALERQVAKLQETVDRLIFRVQATCSAARAAMILKHGILVVSMEDFLVKLPIQFFCNSSSNSSLGSNRNNSSRHQHATGGAARGDSAREETLFGKAAPQATFLPKPIFTRQLPTVEQPFLQKEWWTRAREVLGICNSTGFRSRVPSVNGKPVSKLRYTPTQIIRKKLCRVWRRRGRRWCPHPP